MRVGGSVRTTVTLAAVFSLLLVLLQPGPRTATAAEPALRAFSADSFWNTPLPTDAPLHAESGRIIDFLKHDNAENGCFLLMGAGSDKWGEPIFWAETGDREYDVVGTRYYLPPEFDRLRIPAEAKAAANSDQQLVIYDLERGYVSWLWKATYDPTLDIWSVGGGSIAYLASDGLHAKLPGADEARNTGSHRGLNGAITAVRYDEVQAGAIEHVLKIGINSVRDEHLFPMIGSDGDSLDRYAPPQGARLRIKPSVDLSRYSLHPQARPIAKAMQEYGVIVGDSTGAPIALKLEDTVTEGYGQLWELSKQALCSIPIEAFEVIDYGYVPPAGTRSTVGGGTTDGGTTTDGADTTDGGTTDGPAWSWQRLAGEDRIGTAVAVSKTNWEQADTVLIARADDPADALSGTALAGAHDAPLLITMSGGLHSAVEAEVKRLGATRAFVLGGPGALSDQVVRDLRSAGVATVTRVAGPSRSATAAAVAAKLPVPSGGTAFLVRGDSSRTWADALAVSGLAARRAAAGQAWPVLLVSDDVPEATLSALADLEVSEAVIVGGTAVIPTTVEDRLRSKGLDVRRIAGRDRYETSLRVAMMDSAVTTSPLVAATGSNFPDGLAAGALAARLDGVLLLVGSQPSSAQISWVASTMPAGRGIAVGGEAVLSGQALEGLSSGV
ncbi:MAG: cell wall-binding repeat-containing protein [Actinobacteria bacterium]|nr:cell wall-binding repeat-containing protein [Actinomycetota bacterium]